MLLAPSWRRLARAAEVEVPIPVQVALMARVVKYDRNATDRMAGTCRVLIVRRTGDDGSASAAAAARSELAGLADIGGAPVSVMEHDWVDADTLARRCADARIAIVVVTPGLSDVVGGIGLALTDKDMLTVSLLGEDVEKGVVLGFSLSSSRPTIVVHLGQARKQNVDFSARLLAIAKVIE